MLPFARSCMLSRSLTRDCTCGRQSVRLILCARGRCDTLVDALDRRRHRRRAAVLAVGGAERYRVWHLHRARPCGEARPTRSSAGRHQSAREMRARLLCLRWLQRWRGCDSTPCNVHLSYSTQRAPVILGTVRRGLVRSSRARRLRNALRGADVPLRHERRLRNRCEIPTSRKRKSLAHLASRHTYVLDNQHSIAERSRLQQSQE